MTASKQQVSAFLRDFKEKMKIWNILFRDDRGKNAQTLLDLELRPLERLKIIAALECDDYSDGPLEDTLNKGPAMWIFGKQVKQQEIYHWCPVVEKINTVYRLIIKQVMIRFWSSPT